MRFLSKAGTPPQIKEIIVCANGDAAKIKREATTAFISLTDMPNDSDKHDPAPCGIQYLFPPELRLYFADVDLLRLNDSIEKGVREHAARLAMKPEQATALWQFLYMQPDEVRKLVVSCDVGVSRSKSAALAICDCLQLSRAAVRHGFDQNIITNGHLNEHVYNLVRKTHGLFLQQEK